MLRLLFRRRSLRLRSDVQGAKLGVHGLGELGRGAFLEGRVAAVGRGDRVRADRERAGREHRLARAVQRAAAESGRAVLEGHRAARGDPDGALRRHRRGESHRLPGHRGVGRGADQRGGAGAGPLHRLGERARSASAEGRVAAVGRGDRVRPDRERAGREHRLARAVQRAGAEGAQAVLEGHGAGRGAGAGGAVVVVAVDVVVVVGGGVVVGVVAGGAVVVELGDVVVVVGGSVVVEVVAGGAVVVELVDVVVVVGGSLVVEVVAGGAVVVEVVDVVVVVGGRVVVVLLVEVADVVG